MKGVKIFIFTKTSAPLKFFSNINKILAGEDIVHPISNNRLLAMSAHHIPGLEKVPRVWLFAI